MIIAETTKTSHRWFIWTVLFLIVSGVSLVSYIMIMTINEDADTYNSLWVPPVHSKKK